MVVLLRDVVFMRSVNMRENILLQCRIQSSLGGGF